MATTFKVKMDGRFQKEARGRIEKFYFETGVLEDKPHRLPKKRLKGEKTNSPGLLKTYAGGPARATGRRKSGLTIAQVSERLDPSLEENRFQGKHGLGAVHSVFHEAHYPRREAPRKEAAGKRASSRRP